MIVRRWGPPDIGGSRCSRCPFALRAQRGCFVAVGVAWLGLALSAQAAHATYSKVQIVKINQGGDPNDVFTFDTQPDAGAEPGVVHAQGRRRASSVYSVECNAVERLHVAVGQLDADHHRARGRRLHAHRRSSAAARRAPTGGPASPTRARRSTRTRRSISATQEDQRSSSTGGSGSSAEVTNTRDTGTIKVTKKLAPGHRRREVQPADRRPGQGHQRRRRRHHRRRRPSCPAPTRWARRPARPPTSPTTTRRTSCVDKAHPAKPADTDGSVQVAKGDQWECVITNTRKSTPPPPQEPPTDQPPASRRAAVQAVSPQVRVSPARVRPGSAKLQRAQRLPDHQRGRGHRLGPPDRQGDVLRRRQEGQDAHQGQPQRPLGAADERQALRVRHAPRPGRPSSSPSPARRRPRRCG